MLTCAKKYSSEEQYMSFANCTMAELVGTAAGARVSDVIERSFGEIKKKYRVSKY